MQRDGTLGERERQTGEASASCGTRRSAPSGTAARRLAGPASVSRRGASTVRRPARRKRRSRRCAPHRSAG